ncbi:hypothetical protein GGR57DRAFT_498075 [Xylariaceae sp. FL1272]|nr:hypothetical protein GGR57DRAFT_498075 [Xylariaceae sp. FL1272]
MKNAACSAKPRRKNTVFAPYQLLGGICYDQSYRDYGDGSVVGNPHRSTSQHIGVTITFDNESPLTTMSKFTDLPCELIVIVLKQLNSFDDLRSLLLTCRHVYLSYKEVSTSAIARAILQQQTGPVFLYYAIAVHEATWTPSPSPPMTCVELLDALNDKTDALLHRMHAYPLATLARLGHTHSLIEKHVERFASAARRFLTQPTYRPWDRHMSAFCSHSLSPTERFRICRAFYRFELFVTVFRVIVGHEDHDLEELFFSRYSYQEMEQFACIYDFLYYEWCRVLLKVVRSRSELQAVGIMQEPYKQLKPFAREYWITQGLRFMNKVENTASLEDVQALMKSAVDPQNREYRFTMQSIDELGDYLHYGQMKSTVLDAEDDDEGPLTTWSSLSERREQHGFEDWNDENEANRLSAWVFWDLAHMEKYQMVDFFKAQWQTQVLPSVVDTDEWLSDTQE